jgi:hypothetical protein
MKQFKIFPKQLYHQYYYTLYLEKKKLKNKNYLKINIKSIKNIQIFITFLNKLFSLGFAY